QIFTKPGTGKFHGGAAFTFSDAVFNSRNPFALNRPPYQRRGIEGNLSGPLSKRASFFFNFGRRNIDDTGVINATTLDASLNPRTVNEVGFQYIWYYITQKPSDPSPGLIVLDAFSGGGAQIGNYSFKRHEDEFRDYVTVTTRAHTIKVGARFRWAHISDIAPNNFGGTFIFTSLDRYRRTLLHTST